MKILNLNSDKKLIVAKKEVGKLEFFLLCNRLTLNKSLL